MQKYLDYWDRMYKRSWGPFVDCFKMPECFNSTLDHKYEDTIREAFERK